MFSREIRKAFRQTAAIVAIATLILPGAAYAGPGAADRQYEPASARNDHGLQGPTPVGRSDEERLRIRQHDGRVIEVLRGRLALVHLENLRSRKAEAFAKASASATARGWRPTEEVVVYRSVLEGVSASDAIYTDEGEVVFWSWTDGDDSTWEGEMWSTNYSSGGEVIEEAQVDVAVEGYPVLYSSIIHSKDGEFHKDPASNGGASTASLVPMFDTRQFIKDWIGCVVGCCVLAAGGCLLSGPGWAGCMLLMCVGACQTGCALQEIIRRL
jgi:hypothetical protein